MKKLMMTVAIVCAAVMANAATVQWNSGTMTGASSAAGGKKTMGTANFISANLATDTKWSTYLWLVDAATYNTYSAKTAADIYAAYSGQTGTASTKADITSANTATLTTSADVGVSQYAIIVSTYTDKTFGDMYVATAATIAGTSIVNPDSTYKVNNILSGSGGTPAVGGSWSPVPEPTSGLLLLIGMAGLALRRRCS